MTDQTATTSTGSPGDTTTEPVALLARLRAEDDGPAARLERTFAATADEVWAAITDPQRISRWLAPLTMRGEPQPGTTYTFDFGDGGSTHGEIVACTRGERLEVTWGFEGHPDSIVVVELRPGDDGTTLVLDHRRLPDDQAIGYGAGWDAYIARLAADVDVDVDVDELPDWDEHFVAVLPAYRSAYPGGVAGTAVPSGHLLGTSDHPVVIVERMLKATPAEVWQAWTDPERLVRWLGAVDAPMDNPGATVRVAMAATELPDDPSAAENPATFTVREAVAPSGDTEGRLVFVFDDAADPGGVVTVTMQADGDDACHLVLRQAMAAAPTALGYSSGFGAGWEGFFDWLEDALAEREHGQDLTYDAVTPHYERQRERLGRVSGGSIDSAHSLDTIRHERVITAPADVVWGLLTTSHGIERWLGTVTDGAFGNGERVAIVHLQSDPDASRQESLVTEWDPPRRLAMTWEYSGEAPSSVEFTLTPDGAFTRLELVHRDLATMGAEYLAGWHAHLDVLVAQAEGWSVPPWREAFEAISHGAA
ncbi:MAG: SRPBCC domain-containing protein [Ilumatobacteraceae bacterium]